MGVRLPGNGQALGAEGGYQGNPSLVGAIRGMLYIVCVYVCVYMAMRACCLWRVACCGFRQWRGAIKGGPRRSLERYEVRGEGGVWVG